jgi:hypothetical protein
LDEIDVRIRQTKFIRKFQLLRLWKPRRHGPQLRYLRDLTRMFLDVGIVK